MKIQAAVVREKSGPFALETLWLDEPRPDEVLVRIVGAGVCHTDLVCRDQYFPVPLPCVFGHEGSGVVEKVGAAVAKVAPGDHVVLSFRSCGTCASCKQGRPGYCLQLYGYNFAGARPDGSLCHRDATGHVHGAFFAQSSFATYALAHESNTVKVPREAPLEILGPLGCGIQTGAGAVMNALHPIPGSSIAIFGCGSVGLSAVLGAVLSGCATIVAVDLIDARLELARELGATHTVNPRDRPDAVQAVHEASGGGVLYSLECTGLPGVVRQAVDSLALTGVCGLIGVAPLGTEAALDMNSILFGRTVRGIIEGDSVPDLFIPRMVELHRQGRFPFDRLLTRYGLADVQRAVADTEQGRVVKAVLIP
jgi:aryl-alcohol dehydrogenase